CTLRAISPGEDKTPLIGTRWEDKNDWPALDTEKAQDKVRDGYTPHTSRSRVKTDLYRKFLGSEGDPAMTTVLMLAKDNGSMLRLYYLKAIGVGIVDTDMNKDRQRMSPYPAAGFSIMFCFVCIPVYADHGCISTVSVGILVYDSFLTLHAWLRQPLRHSPVTRLGKVLEEVGPSVTKTTLTNVITLIFQLILDDLVKNVNSGHDPT
ncbi:hypothetical protein ANCDUO_24352, partial [Ancylostoma duodenale]